MLKKGIDVSYSQGAVNWGHVNADFAIIRAGYGRLASQKDAQFENNYAGCKSNKIPVGAFWFTYATSEAEAVEEAKACLEVIKGKTFEYPIYYDMENSYKPDGTPIVIYDKFGKSKCTAIAKAFLDTIEKAGYWVGIYASKSFLDANLSAELRKRYAVWCAQYYKECTYTGAYGMWQYSSTGSMNGIKGNVDTDYCYVDYPTLIKNKGLNGFKKTNTSTTTAAKPTAAKPTAPAAPSIKVGDKVKVEKGAKDFDRGASLASFVYNTTYTVQQINGERVVIGINGAVTAAVHKKNLIKV